MSGSGDIDRGFGFRFVQHLSVAGGGATLPPPDGRDVEGWRIKNAIPIGSGRMSYAGALPAAAKRGKKQKDHMAAQDVRSNVSLFFLLLLLERGTLGVADGCNNNCHWLASLLGVPPLF